MEKIKMRGSEKQIAWATEILSTILQIENCMLETLQDQMDNEKVKQNVRFIQAWVKRIEAAEYAGDVIELFRDVKYTGDARKDVKALVALRRTCVPYTSSAKALLMLDYAPNAHEETAENEADKENDSIVRDDANITRLYILRDDNMIRFGQPAKVLLDKPEHISRQWIEQMDVIFPDGFNVSVSADGVHRVYNGVEHYDLAYSDAYNVPVIVDHHNHGKHIYLDYSKDPIFRKRIYESGNLGFQVGNCAYFAQGCNLYRQYVNPVDNWISALPWDWEDLGIYEVL